MEFRIPSRAATEPVAGFYFPNGIGMKASGGWSSGGGLVLALLLELRGDLGIECGGFLEGFLGFAFLAQPAEHYALVVPSVGMTGMILQNLVVADQRLDQPVRLAQGDSAIEPDLGVMGIDRQRLVVTGQLLLGAAELA